MLGFVAGLKPAELLIILMIVGLPVAVAGVAIATAWLGNRRRDEMALPPPPPPPDARFE